MKRGCGTGYLEADSLVVIHPMQDPSLLCVLGQLTQPPWSLEVGTGIGLG